MKGLYISILTCAYLLAFGQYTTSPNWISTDKQYSTGGVFADINNDGYPDFIVANGNDMAKQKLVVYYNNGGTLQTSPGWQSAINKYHGHIAVGDINGDGWLDVAVAILISENGPGVQVYFNQGGVLEATPSWSSAISFYGWHVALGDADNDGDLDLLVGSSDAYGSKKWKNYIFYNHNGALEPVPSWQSDDNRNLDHMEFADVDNDGDLDVIAIGSKTYNWAYRNNNGLISTVPDWQSTDNGSQFANTLCVGDVNGDGHIDFIMSDNNQLTGGSGRFKLYRNLGNGMFEVTPGWSYYVGYVSGIALADLNNDGKLDFIGGSWWGKVLIFMNTGTGFTSSPSWTSANSMVVEAICFGDLNRDGLVVKQEKKDVFTGKTVMFWDVSPFIKPFGRTTARTLYYLDKQPIEYINKVFVDGIEIPYNEYCYNAMNGWVSLKNKPKMSVLIEYTYTTKPDMGVTDWDNGTGNVVYYYQ